MNLVILPKLLPHCIVAIYMINSTWSKEPQILRARSHMAKAIAIAITITFAGCEQ